MKLKTLASILVVACLAGSAVSAGEVDSPFSFSARLRPGTADGEWLVQVSAKIADGAYLYADALKVSASGNASLEPKSVPKPKTKKDPITGEDVGVHVGEPLFVHALKGNVEFPVEISVDFQGCDDTSCFMPQTETFSLSPPGNTASTTADTVESNVDQTVSTNTAEGLKSPLNERLDAFKVVARASGYMSSEKFNAFLAKALKSSDALDADASEFEGKSMILTIILIFLGGLALNLTPCVLPMIPITLSIIGVGANSKSDARGVVLGILYGGAAALVYGGLGAAVILTGSRFGALNASPWFNYVVAVVFVALSLGMFDVFIIDFSRFQSKTGTANKSGSYLSVFVLGAVSALLAGACVAPVVISVMVFSMGLYANGNVFALALPLLLGAGMASPWPFLGAGVSLFPKPGAWMKHVKHAFGVLILLFAAYYGYLGYTLQFSQSEPLEEAIDGGDGWLKSLSAGFSTAADANKPLLIDFHAEWCKNCHTMDATTFLNPSTIKALKPFVKVKFDATDIKNPDVKRILDHYQILGLPTYLVLRPTTAAAKRPSPSETSPNS